MAGEATAQTGIGLRVASLAFVMGLVLLGLGATIGETAAADTLPGTVSVSKAEYISICVATGGNAIEQSNGSVTCFYPDGSWSNCEFETNTCQDSPSIRLPPGVIFDPPAGIVARPTDAGGQDRAPMVDGPSAGSHATADDDQKRNKEMYKDKKKKKDSSNKKRGHRGKARKS
jgi:hypothetical protein